MPVQLPEPHKTQPCLLVSPALCCVPALRAPCDLLHSSLPGVCTAARKAPKGSGLVGSPLRIVAWQAKCNQTPPPQFARSELGDTIALQQYQLVAHKAIHIVLPSICAPAMQSELRVMGSQGPHASAPQHRSSSAGQQLTRSSPSSLGGSSMCLPFKVTGLTAAAEQPAKWALCPVSRACMARGCQSLRVQHWTCAA